jgi:predicted MPP superfamily phosphohydrolase
MHFLYLFLSSLVLGLIYIWFRFVRLTAKKPFKRAVLGLFILSFVCAVFASFPLKLKGGGGIFTDLISWYGYIGIGYLSFLLFLLLTRDIVRVTLRLVVVCRDRKRGFLSPDGNPGGVDHGRRMFLEQGAIAGTAAVFSGAGIIWAHKTPEVKEVHIPIHGLHEDLRGFSIVQISDIHIGPTLKGSFLEKVVRRVNGLNPDVVALTGDLPDGYVKELYDDVKPLEGLSSRHGNFFVTGNHEYYFNALQWVAAVESLGFRTLLNEHVLIEHGRGRLVLAGVPDLRAERFVPEHRPDAVAAIKNAPEAHARILLAHQPKAVFQAAGAGFNLQISGHTHGGQIFPWNFIVKINQPFLSGLYTHEGVQLYVSRGTGYWGPPMRFLAPSEITRIVLEKA